jgi:hypothetical protein
MVQDLDNPFQTAPQKFPRPALPMPPSSLETSSPLFRLSNLPTPCLLPLFTSSGASLPADLTSQGFFPETQGWETHCDEPQVDAQVPEGEQAETSGKNVGSKVPSRRVREPVILWVHPGTSCYGLEALL